MSKKKIEKVLFSKYSLLECTIIAAIMIVLVIVLAPQYLGYIEKVRLEKDNAAITKIVRTVKNAMADEAIGKKVPSGTMIIWNTTNGRSARVIFAEDVLMPGDAPEGSDTSGLIASLTKTHGQEHKTRSKTYKESDVNIVLRIMKMDGTITVEVIEGWIESLGTEPSGKAF